jgi:hypothetical protein
VQYGTGQQCVIRWWRPKIRGETHARKARMLHIRGRKLVKLRAIPGLKGPRPSRGHRAPDRQLLAKEADVETSGLCLAERNTTDMLWSGLIPPQRVCERRKGLQDLGSDPGHR